MKKFLLGVSILVAQAAVAASVEVHRATGPIRVDGLLDEAPWAAATAIPIAWEHDPRVNEPAPVKTDALVTWDDQYLYVAFRAADPQPRRIRARYNERDSATGDDLVGFYLDPFNDDRRAYQFRVNPLGVQLDAINDEVEGSEDFSWDGIWESAGRLTGEGFTVEIAVPLQQLRIPQTGDPQVWGFLAMRQWPRDLNHRLRSIHTDPNRDCLVCQFDDITGVQSSTSGRNLEVTPTLTGISQDVTGEEVQDVEPGVTARWGITTGTSLQATINPDFSQVEADAAQLDVNTRFALFFPEKRPFFVEGADFFETQLPLAFTRTIADPIVGLKLTGKSRGHSYGVLAARDEVTNLLIPGDQSSRLTSIEGESTMVMARYRRDFGQSMNVGGYLSSRTGNDYGNQVLAVDSYYRVRPSDSLRLQGAASSTDYPDEIAAAFEQPSDWFRGHALQAGYRHNTSLWFWAADYVEASPEFRADAGFFNQVGVRQGATFVQRRIRGGDRTWFSDIYLGCGVDATEQYEGDWTEWGSDISITYEGPRQSTISLNLAPNQEFFLGTTYHNFRQSLFVEFQLNRDIELEFEVRSGEAIDFTNAQPAEFLTLVPAVGFNIGRHVGGVFEYAREVFEKPNGERIYAVDLPQLRMLYHLNRRAFVRVIAQYEMLERNPASYARPVESESEQLLSQLLFSYRVNAQTALLVGYSDFSEGSEFIDLTRVQQTIFVKLSYAFLF